MSACFASDVTYDPVTLEGSHVIVDNEELTSVNNVFILKTKNNAPMPEGSVNGEKKIVSQANNKFNFGKIQYNKPGAYEYTISRQITPSNRLAQDDSVYNIRVGVFSDGSNVLVFQKEGESAKADKIEYEDVYLQQLTFKLNGGTLNGSSENIVKYYQKGTVITLPKAPVKEDYIFDYWKGSKYAAGAKYKVKEDHKFTAIYKSSASSSDSEDQSGNSNGTKDKTNSNSKDITQNTNSKTGDETQTAILFVMLVLVSLLIYVISKKERKRNG